MNNLEQVEKAFRIYNEVLKEETGSRDAFAEIIGISPRQLTKYVRKLESILNTEILYSRKRCTYFVSNNCKSKLP